MDEAEPEDVELSTLLANQYQDLTALTTVMEDLCQVDKDTSPDRFEDLLREQLALQRALESREDEIYDQLTTQTDASEPVDPTTLRSVRTLVRALGVALGSSRASVDAVSEIQTDLRRVLQANRQEWLTPPGLQG